MGKRDGSNPGERRRWIVSSLGEYKNAVLTSIVDMEKDSAAATLRKIFLFLLDAVSANVSKKVLSS